MKKVLKGYTILELLIVVTIVGLMVTLGISAYSKANERQIALDSKEQLASALQKAQKAAYVGQKDCSGELIGITVTASGSTLNTQSSCKNSSGTNYGVAQSQTFSSLVFASSPNFTFQPLDGGVSFPTIGQTSANLDYMISGKTYRYTISSSGIITYLGQISP